VKKTIYYMISLVITAMWGLSFPLMRNIGDNISSHSYLFFRFLIATISLIVIFYKKIDFNDKILHAKSFILGLLLFGTLNSTVVALKHTKSSNVAFLIGLNVVLVPLISSFFEKNKIKTNAIVANFIAIIGIYFLSGGTNFSFNKGDLFAILTAFFISGRLIFLNKFSKEEDHIKVGIFQIFYCFLLTTLFWFQNDGYTEKIIFSKELTLIIIFTGVFATSLAFFGQTYIQRHISATKSSLLITTESVFGVIFSILIPKTDGTKEFLTNFGIIGCLLIFTAMIVSELTFNKKEVKGVKEAWHFT